jgi:hypothetical protein
MGLPEIEYIGVDESSARATDVTVPLPVEAIVIFEPEGVMVMPVPATSVNAPVKPFKLVTPLPEPPPDGG